MRRCFSEQKVLSDIQQIENTLDHIQSKKSFDAKYKSKKLKQKNRPRNHNYGNSLRLSLSQSKLIDSNLSLNKRAEPQMIKSATKTVLIHLETLKCFEGNKSTELSLIKSPKQLGRIRSQIQFSQSSSRQHLKNKHQKSRSSLQFHQSGFMGLTQRLSGMIIDQN